MASPPPPPPPYRGPQPQRRPMPAPFRPARTINDPGAMHGRMTPISHTGPLPWVQLRNALFHPSIFPQNDRQNRPPGEERGSGGGVRP